MINFTSFLEEGIISQDEYARKSNTLSPLQNISELERYAKVIEHLGHLTEEVIEARMLVPRRSWKKNEVGYLSTSELKKQFCYEMTDILLFFRAVMAYSGISPYEFERHFFDKISYNTKRTDHIND